MGNYNSGYHREKKQLVENSIKLDIHYLFKDINIQDDMDGTIRLPAVGGLSVEGDFKIEQKKQSYTWINEYETVPTPPHTLFIYDYKIFKTYQDIENNISTKVVGDGFLRVEINRLKRVCVKCPRCGRWLTMLYIPVNSQEFACIDCHNLTYESVQTANSKNDWFKQIYDEVWDETVKKLSKEN